MIKWVRSFMSRQVQRFKEFISRQAQKVKDYSVVISGTELTLIVIILIIPMICLPLLGFISVQDEIKTLKVQVEILKEDQAAMNRDQQKLTEVQRRLTDAMMNWLEVWQVDMFKASAYAPLDNRSGMCADGDPRYMATMAKTEENLDVAIAVDPKVIPLHSPVYIFGVGWRKALDTGGLIKGNKIDVCMAKHEDAVKFSIKDVIAVWPRQQPSPAL